MLHWLKGFAQRRPLATQVILSTTLAAGGDHYTQKVVERRKELDVRRSAVFITFGCLNGLLSYYVYVTLMSRSTRYLHTPLHVPNGGLTAVVAAQC